METLEVNSTESVLKVLDKGTRHTFCKVVNGIGYYLSTGDVIDPEHFIYQAVPEDGYYELDPGICKGGKNPCEVGNRHPRDVCRMSVKTKCGVWDTTKIRDISKLDVYTLVDIIKLYGTHSIHEMK